MKAVAGIAKTVIRRSRQNKTTIGSITDSLYRIKSRIRFTDNIAKGTI